MHKINVYHQTSTRQVVLVEESHVSSYYVTNLKEELSSLIKDHLTKPSDSGCGIGMIPHSIITIDDENDVAVELIGAEKTPPAANDNIPSDL